jgi:iron(III) transport system permease protein
MVLRDAISARTACSFETSLVIHAPVIRRRATQRHARRALWTLLGLLALGSLASLLVLLDARTASLLGNTLFLCATTLTISLPLGSVLAWLLVRTDVPGRRAALVLFGVMPFVPLYLQAAGWQAGFGLQGWYTMRSAGPVWLEGWTGAIWVHAVAAVPWVVLIVGAGFWLVEPELEEEALLDGSPWQVFWHVTLRGATGALGVAAIWIAIVAAGEMTVTDLFAVRTYAEEVYTRQAVGPQPGDLPLGGMPGVILTAWLVLAGLVLVVKVAPRDRPVSAARRVVFPLGRWRIPMAGLVALSLLIVVGVPLASLGYKAGIVVTQLDDVRVRSWSLGKCLRMVAGGSVRYAWELGSSLVIGTLAATVSTAAGVMLAWFARRGVIRATTVLVLTAICLAVPGPIVGLGVISLLNRPEIPPLVYLYDRSILAPLLALSFRGLAPATLVMWHAVRTIPREMLESASLDGAGPVGRLFRIVLPCRLGALVVAWLVALAIALGDLAASVLVMPPGVRTLSIHIFNLLHYGVEDRVAGMCLALVALFAAVAAGIARLVSRWGSREAVTS